MTKRKSNIIGHDPLSWISVDDEDEVAEKELSVKFKQNSSVKSGSDSKPKDHPLGIDVEAFNRGYELMQDKTSAIVSDFYETLFAEYPSVKPLFESSDLLGQEKKLASVLGLLAKNINDIDKLVSVLSVLGKSHQKYGATEEHYSAVANTLLVSIKKNIGRKWTKKIAENWEAVLLKGAEVMLNAYEELPEPSESNLPETSCDEEGVLYLDAMQDISTVAELLDNIKNYIANDQLYINISKVTRVDASCLQILYLVFRDADINGYETKIMGSSEAFERSVNLLGMSHVLKVAA